MKLIKGMKIKNYKELCDIMNWKITSGDSKKSQLKELDTLCEYHKEGNKFIIDKVFKKPKRKEDGRVNNKGNSAEYIEFLETLLLGEMLTNDLKSHNRLFIGKSVLLRDVGLVNINYSCCKRRPRKLAQYLGVEEETVIEYFNLNNKSLTNDLERALKNLKNKALIMLNTSTIICKNETSIIDYKHDIIIDEYDEEIDKVQAETCIDKIFVEATPEERNLIVKAKAKILKDMGETKISTIFAKNKTKEYYKRIYEELRYNIKDLNFFFDAYDIVYEFDNIAKELNKIGYDDWDNDSKTLLMDIVNSGIINKIDINSQRRHNKSIPKMGELHKGDKNYNRSRKDYVNETNKISNTVINIHSDNVKKLVLQQKIIK